MKNRRVVVTGIGAISPVGNNVQTMWGNLIKGKSGIDFVTKVDKNEFPAKVAGEVKDFDILQYLEKKRCS